MKIWFATLTTLFALGDVAAADTATAAADTAPVDAPPPKPGPGLTLGAGQLNVAVNLEINATSDAEGKPTSIAPDVSYGVTDDLTVILVHSTFLTTGFRGGAGAGLCLTGEEDGCKRVYNNVGAEALYAVRRGPLSIAAGGGVHALDLDAGFHAVKLGARLRYKTGAVFVASSPSVFVALTERGEEMGVTINPDRLYVPIMVGYQVTDPVWVALGTGVKGPLQGFGDAYQISAGALAGYKLDARMAVGASLIFGRVNRDDDAADRSGADHRAVQLWFSYTR
jgi:hypothetical protein